MEWNGGHETNLYTYVHPRHNRAKKFQTAHFYFFTSTLINSTLIFTPLLSKRDACFKSGV